MVQDKKKRQQLTTSATARPLVGNEQTRTQETPKRGHDDKARRQLTKAEEIPVGQTYTEGGVGKVPVQAPDDARGLVRT